MGGTVSLYGRITDIASQSDCPFVFDHGYRPLLGDGIEFAYAKRFLLVSPTPHSVAARGARHEMTVFHFLHSADRSL